MDCASCEDLLSAIEESRPAPEVLGEIRRHLAGCARCRSFSRLLETGADLLGEEGRERLARGILERTTGPTCLRAKGILPDWVDGPPARDDAGLLAGHVRHCPGCGSLAETLAALRAALPEFSLLDPGPDFAAAVLAQTAHLPAAQRRRQRRWRDLGIRLLQRPRFALEAAYAATLCIVLILGTPAVSKVEASAAVAQIADGVRRSIDSMADVAPPAWVESAAESVGTGIRAALGLGSGWESLRETAGAWHGRVGAWLDSVSSRIFESIRSLLEVLERLPESFIREEPSSAGQRRTFSRSAACSLV